MIDYLFRRVLAYTIDMLLVSVVVSSLISTSVINFQLDDYNKYYEEYLELYTSYYEQTHNKIETCDDLDKAIEEENLTEDKYVLDYQKITASLEKKEINNEEYDASCLAIVNDYNNSKMTDAEYLEKVEYYYYHTEKKSVVMYVINIVVCILYFVFFQGFTYGQTLGKKIMRLKVVSVDGDTVSYKKLFIRSLFLFSIIYYIFTIISILIVPESYFSVVTNVLYLLNSILFVIIGFTIIFDKERRGLHGMISKTKVILIDRKGNEIKVNKKDVVKEDVKEVSNEDKTNSENKKLASKKRKITPKNKNN